MLQQLEDVKSNYSVNDTLVPVSTFFDRIFRAEQLITALLPPATTDEDKKLHTHILDEVFREADQDQDEKLSYDEFLKAVAHSDIRSKLTIAF